MQTFAPRAARRALARTVVILAAIGALGACADETTAPAANAPSRAVAKTAAPSPEASATSVNVDVAGGLIFPGFAGAFVGVEPTCSPNQTVNLVVSLEQEQRQGSTKTLVRGFGILQGVQCTQATGAQNVIVTPFGNARFQPGRATVYASATSPLTGGGLAEATRRVRLDVLQ